MKRRGRRTSMGSRARGRARLVAAVAVTQLLGAGLALGLGACETA